MTTKPGFATQSLGLGSTSPTSNIGAEVVRLFLSEVDAKTVIEKTKAACSIRIGNSVLVAVPVPLLMTIREILRKAGTNIGFVVHSSSEVYEFE